MKDVAREAGVALGTVSRVFNDLPVGESYRRRVEEAAEKLGYKVNSYARGLRAGETRTVAVIMPSLQHPFFAALTDRLTSCLFQRGYRTLLYLTAYDSEAEQICIDMGRHNKADGIIALTYSRDLVLDEALPYVSIDRCLGTNIPCVASDNFGGGQLAAQKLNEFGCRKLLFFRIGSDLSAEPDKRGAGFEDYCRRKGLPYYCLSLRDEDGMEPFYRFLEEHMAGGAPEFDGIFCSTDKTAFQCCRKLRSMGIDIPGQVQVIGFDGVRMMDTESLYCSTIVQPVDKLAEAAVNTLLSEDRSSLICLPVTFAQGGTTKEI